MHPFNHVVATYVAVNLGKVLIERLMQERILFSVPYFFVREINDAHLGMRNFKFVLWLTYLSFAWIVYNEL